MIVKSFCVNFMHEMTYVVSAENGDCIIIDCGCQTDKEQESVAEYISQNGLKPKRLLCTHFHLDHIMGNEFVKKTYGIDAEACESDHLLMDMIHFQFVAFGMSDDSVVIPQPQYTLSEGTTIKIGDTEFEVITAPGHSPGGIVLYNKKEKVLFSGDTIMYHSSGATNLPGGRKSALKKSLTKIFDMLEDDVVVYPGHGATTTIGEERANNPVWVDAQQ